MPVEVSRDTRVPRIMEDDSLVVLWALGSGPESWDGPGVLAWLSAVLILVCEFWGWGHGTPPACPSTQTWSWTGQISCLWPRFYVSELPATWTTNFQMCLVFFFFYKWTHLKGLKFVHEPLKPSAFWVTLWGTLAYPFIAWNRSPLLILLCLQAVKLPR